MTLRLDKHGRPEGLDWNQISTCPQDPSVWTAASLTKPKTGGLKIPDGDELEIVRLHLEGVSAADIAEQIGVSAPTVSKVLDRREVTENRGRGTRQRTPDDVQQEVVRLYTKEGLGGAGIRAQTGLSHATVYKILRRHGISPRSKVA